jgi:hypothetical protein
MQFIPSLQLKEEEKTGIDKKKKKKQVIYFLIFTHTRENIHLRLNIPATFNQPQLPVKCQS